jgi:hypothetical protein
MIHLINFTPLSFRLARVDLILCYNYDVSWNAMFNQTFNLPMSDYVVLTRTGTPCSRMGACLVTEVIKNSDIRGALPPPSLFSDLPLSLGAGVR